MFWNIFVKLCHEDGSKPTAIALKLGFSNATATKWKNGSIPQGSTLQKIADYFGVTVDYLLGKTENPTGEGELTEHEAKVLNAYRNQPEMQIAVDRLLGIYNDEYVQLYTAASSKDNRPDKIIKMPKENWEKIKNTPDTDDTLM